MSEEKKIFKVRTKQPIYDAYKEGNTFVIIGDENTECERFSENSFNDKFEIVEEKKDKLDMLVEKLLSNKVKEELIVKSCPACYYKSVGYGGCEIYRNLELAAIIIPDEMIPSDCPVREKLGEIKERNRKNTEEYIKKCEAKKQDISY